MFGPKDYLLAGFAILIVILMVVVNINRAKIGELKAEVSALETKIDAQNNAIAEEGKKRQEAQDKFTAADKERKQIRDKFDSWLKDLAGRPLATNCPDSITELKLEMSRQFKEWKK